MQQRPESEHENDAELETVGETAVFLFFLPLLKEAVSDQVVCWAPVINNLSQIQPGMTGKLTCSSFHTLSHRSAQ